MASRYTIIAASEKKDDKGASVGQAALYETFMMRHPTYDAEYWERLECLYKGGRALLENEKVMARIFPKHRGELDQIYDERVRCAHYIPWAAEIVGNTVTGVFSDPITVGSSEKGSELPEFYGEFINDVTRPEKRTECSMTEFVGERLLQSLIKGCSWAQIDLPKVDGEFSTRLEEERAGADRVYMVPLNCENVIDWEEDEDGDLLWAITMKTTNRRSTPDANRKLVTEEFTVMDREGYQVFEITYDPEKPPKEKTPVPLMDSGVHTFGIVPLLRIELPDGLRAMEKMESACRALLRDLNSMSWAMRQSLHQELYEYLAPEMMTGGIPPDNESGDPNRAHNQQRGQGWVQVRGHQDRAEYIGPGTEGFEFALKSVMMHRDEMHRVNNQMGTNADVDSGTIRRSAESKQMDTESGEALHRELGKYVRRFIEESLTAARDGRRDPDAALDGLKITGCEKFHQRTTTGHLENALAVQSMAIESPTLDRALKLDVAKVHLGEVLSDKQMKLVEEELEEFIRIEDFDRDMVGAEEVASAIAQSGMRQQPEDEEDDGTWA